MKADLVAESVWVFCLRWQLSSCQYRMQVTTGRAGVTPRDWFLNWETAAGAIEKPIE